MWDFIKFWLLVWFVWWVADATGSTGLGVGLFIGGLVATSSAESVPVERSKEKRGLIPLLVVVLGLGWLLGRDE